MIVFANMTALALSFIHFTQYIEALMILILSDRRINQQTNNLKQQNTNNNRSEMWTSLDIQIIQSK
jgi:hypothetical protein